MYTLPYIQQYKAFVEEKLPEQLLSRSVLAFSKYLERAADAHGCRSFCKAKKLGRVLYNPDRFNPDSIPYVCDMLVQNCSNGEELVLFCQPGTYPEFDSVHMDAWLKLVCAAYLSMSKDNMAYLGGESIGSTYDLLCSDVPVEMYRPALQVVVAHTLPPSTSLQSTRDWYNFVRFVVTMRTLGRPRVLHFG